MGKLTTHVLDTAAGRPGSGIPVKLFAMDADGNGRHRLVKTITNADGRTDAPLLDGPAFKAGTYELEFSVSEYFLASAAACDEPTFLSEITIRVTLSRDSHYHVPLLASPWSYSTYRGS